MKPAVQPCVLKPKFQAKRKHRSDNLDGVDDSVGISEVGASLQHVGVLYANDDVVVEESSSVRALQKSGCYGRIFPEPAFRRRKGEVCVSDFDVPNASELKLHLEGSKRPSRKQANNCEDPAETVAASTAEEVQPIEEPQRLVKLNSEEALYLLHELSAIRILRDADNEFAFTSEEFYSHCYARFGGINFVQRYLAYRYYRRKDWVVKDGEPYGVHFVLYKSHPAEFHSSYGVLVTSPQKTCTWRKLSGLCRTVSTVSKELILCTIYCDRNGQESISLSDLDHCRITEMHVKTWFAKHHYDHPTSEQQTGAAANCTTLSQ